MLSPENVIIRFKKPYKIYDLYLMPYIFVPCISIGVGNAIHIVQKILWRWKGGRAT